MTLTLEERMKADELRAREHAAEKHFFDMHQPFFPYGFSVTWRNPGHWDIFAGQVPGKDAAWLTAHGEGASINGATIADVPKLTNCGGRERAFCIRGEPGNVTVRDERWNPHVPYRDRELKTFRSVTGAMLYIMEELMQEPKE